MYIHIYTHVSKPCNNCLVVRSAPRRQISDEDRARALVLVLVLALVFELVFELVFVLF